MAVETSKGPALGYTTESTRALLRVVILCFIAAAAIASRLFSVIRKLLLFLQLSFCHVEAIAALNRNCGGVIC